MKTHSLLPRRSFTVSLLALLALGAAACNSSISQARASGTQGASMTWTTFQDPMEKAFTLEVPRGWTARGGLFRMGYSDERPMVDITSPDGSITVRLGDVSVPVYATPNQQHREGTIYDLGAQAQIVAARYRQGPEFAALYDRVRFHQLCQNPTADTTDIDFTVPDYIPSDGPPPARTSTGIIAHHCSTPQGQRVSFAFVRTADLNGQLWGAPTLGSYLAPADQVGTARSVLEHCARTFKLNPQWLDYQKQMDQYALQYQRARQQRRIQELNAQVQQFEQKMQAMRNQVSSFERHQQAQADQVEGFTQALRGVTPTIDPLTGEAREVWTGSQDGYWANGMGGVANSATSPGAGWHQLQVTRPQ